MYSTLKYVGIPSERENLYSLFSKKIFITILRAPGKGRNLIERDRVEQANALSGSRRKGLFEN